jgi:hypothetical protein
LKKIAIFLLSFRVGSALIIDMTLFAPALSAEAGKGSDVASFFQRAFPISKE